MIENHVDSNNSFDLIVDGERYQEAKCSGEIFGDFEHDGIQRGYLYYGIGNAQHSNKTTYYLARVKRYGDDDKNSEAAVLAFKDANTLCLLDSDETDGAKIDQTVQVMATHPDEYPYQCWRKSSLKRFQSLKANPFVTTSNYTFKDLEPTLARLKNQLDTQAKVGFRLYDVRIDTGVTSDTASSLLTSDEMKMRNLYIKDNAANATKWQYQVTTANQDYKLFKAEFSAQASQGFHYRTRYNLDNDKGTFNIYEKRVGDTAVYSVDDRLVPGYELTLDNWINYANELGKTGCRLEFAGYANINQYAFLCTNSNLHKGTYDYRWFTLDNKTNAAQIKTILDQQKAAGYVYRFIIDNGRGYRGLVVERDSSNINLGNLVYKVFDGEPGGDLYLYTQHLIGQSSLGWNLWDIPITVESGISSNHTLTIYANRARD